MVKDSFLFLFKRTYSVLWLSVILLIVPSFYMCSKSKEWTIKDLSTHYKTQKSNIIDPNSYLTPQHFNSIQTNINHIRTNNKFEIFLFIINKMQISNSKDIDHYLNTLSSNILNQDEQRDRFTIFILYSIEDRLSRIRTGKYVRKYLTDSTCVDLQDDIKDLLKSGDYSEAMYDLINSLQLELNGRTFFETFLRKSYKVLKKIGFYLVILGAMIIISYVWNKKENPSTVEKLKKIKKICDSKKPRKEIIETTCVICLELLETENEKKEVKQSSSEITAVSNDENGPLLFEKIELPKIESNTQIEGEHKENEKKIQEENQEKDFVAKLECGHSFHSTCIARWMCKQGKCPVCREQIDKEENDTQSKNETVPVISRQLINIQGVLDSAFLDYNFIHTANDFSWNRRYNYTDSNGGSDSWGLDCGGASSSW